MERNPAVGKPSYLISKQWLKEYKDYVFYGDVKRNNKPVAPNENKHPGHIRNDEELCEVDNKNLSGTGEIDQFEKPYVDKYLKNSISERF